MMNQKRIFDLRPYLFVRLIFGYNPGPQIQIWHLIYSTIVILLLICFTSYFTVPSSTEWLIAEYIINIIISYILNDKHVHQFYQSIPCIDSLPLAEEMYPKIRMYQIAGLLIWFGYRAVHAAGTFYCTGLMLWSTDGVVYSLMLLAWIALDVPMLGFVMIAHLLYIRVKVIAHTMRKNGLDNLPAMKYSARKYMEMYENLMDSLYEGELRLKCLILLFLLTTASRAVPTIFQLLAVYKYTSAGSYLWLSTVSIILPYVTLMWGVLLLDETREELKVVKVLVIQAYVKCRHERVRYDIQLLHTVLDSRPLRYSLWRVVPLSLSMLISTVSFIIVTAMGIAQIRFYST